MDDPYEWLSCHYDAQSDLLGKAITCRALRDAHGSPRKVLDLCCGTGNSLQPHVEAGLTGVGVDRSGPMLNLANQKLLPWRDRSVLLRCEVEEFQYPSASFDIIQCLSFSLSYLTSTALFDLLLRAREWADGHCIIFADFLREESMEAHFDKLSWRLDNRQNIRAQVMQSAHGFADIIYCLERDGKVVQTSSPHRLYNYQEDTLSQMFSDAGFVLEPMPQAIAAITPGDRVALIATRPP